jgi:hypothetical protein
MEKRRIIAPSSILLPDHTFYVTVLASLWNHYALLKLQVNYGCYVVREWTTPKDQCQLPSKYLLRLSDLEHKSCILSILQI